MAEIDEATAADAGRGEPTDDASEAERKLARAVAVGLPVVTVLAFVVVSAMFGLAPGILVLVGGAMVGVIALFWASLRVLSGDAPLSPELEALDASAHEVDQLAVRKRMLLRALKDLDNERALGKLDAEDHDALASTYRAELKDVLRRMDESLAPYRKKAEELAASYLADQGGAAPAKAVTKVETPREPATATRQACSACGTSNEPDARFCKKCGKGLPAGETADAQDEATDEEKTNEA